MSGNSIKFYLDGTEYDSPENWRDTSIEVSLDHDSQIITIDYTTDYIWSGAAYNYLYGKQLANTCDLVNARVDVINGGSVHSIHGVIFIQSLIANETQRTVVGKIEDDGYSARIQNNRSTSIDLNAPKSKNGEALTTQVVYTSVFKPSDGTTYTENCAGMRVYDALTKLVEWMTDKTVGFKSDYFSTGEGAECFLTTSLNLQSLGENISLPSCSFKQIYDTMRALYNVGMGFERIDGTPHVVIEDISHFRNSNNAIRLSDVHDTELSFVQDVLYGRVEVGGEITLPHRCNSGNTACEAANNILWYGFEKETYSISGECNRDLPLDLTVDSKFIIDTSTIQDILEYGNEDYDDKVIIIQMSGPNSYVADNSDPLGLSQNWYNESYTNQYVVGRYEDYLTGAIVAYGISNQYALIDIERAGGSFAEICTTQTFQQSSALPFTTENSDPDNVWNQTTHRYEPNAECVVKFNIDYGVVCDVATACPSGDAGVILDWRIQFLQYDSSGTLITTHDGPLESRVTNWAGVEYYTWETDFIPLDDGDYLEVRYSAQQDFDPAVFHNSIGLFGTELTTVEVYTVIEEGQTNTGTRVTRKKTTTNHPISIDDAFEYIGDTTRNIAMDNQYIGTRSGHAERVKINLYTGESEITLIHD